VQRDRDNAIPDYNTLRVALGLPAVASFAQITRNVQVQQELAKAYPGGVNTIDAFEGGLAEDHVRGSDVGPLFQAILVNQFTRLRDGDRFFYLNENLNPEELRLLQTRNTLAKVIEANTNVTNLQGDVFLFKASIRGTVSSPDLARYGGPRPWGAVGLAGLTVELEDDIGAILASTKTDRQGRYRFNQLNGLSSVGTYHVVLVLPTGMRQVSPALSPIVITSGDTQVAGVDLNIDLLSSRQFGGITLFDQTRMT